MKLFFLSVFLFLSICAYAQSDEKVPGQNKEDLTRRYGNDAARLFKDVLLKDMQYYFANASKIVMYKGDQLVDNILLSQSYYSNGSFSIPLFQVRPRYYNLLKSTICTSKKPTEQNGCAINVKKVCYQLFDDFYYFTISDIKYKGDTLALKVYMGDGEDTLLTNIKFDKRGIIGNSVSYLLSGENKRYKYKELRGQVIYNRDKSGNITTRKITAYNTNNKSIENTVETNYDNQGSRTYEIKKEYGFNRDNSQHIFTNETSFVYDSQHRLTKEAFVHDGKPIMEYLITYEGNYIEIFKNTPASSLKELEFKYNVVK